MRLILVKLFWNFDIRLALESEEWDQHQKANIMWLKKPLVVVLTPREV
jgi:hypothetical protein